MIKPKFVKHAVRHAHRGGEDGFERRVRRPLVEFRRRRLGRAAAVPVRARGDAPRRGRGGAQLRGLLRQAIQVGAILIRVMVLLKRRDARVAEGEQMAARLEQVTG